jgi:hypothetical protein
LRVIKGLFEIKRNYWCVKKRLKARVRGDRNI